MNKPTLPQGTRDFNASTIYKRNYIFNTIRKAFQLYGFEPLETPAMENIDTLMGKYGEEGDKLIFKILNNGLDNPAKKTEVTEAFNKVLNGKLTKQITERALRYDLTIPFARYVAMNHGQLTFPFKRYQMQPVWRADRPQKGRYREFYQCDADVVGSTSLINEVELAHLYAHVFRLLNLPVTIKINNRKILAALAELCGGSEKLIDITVAIDKLDKIGIEKVKEELQQRQLTSSQIEIIADFLSIQGSNQEKIQALHTTIAHIPLGKQGIEELEYILKHQQSNNPLPLEIDVTLARGLNYYTGTIFEVKANNFAIGSIGGGGRYDNLTELFGVANMPGVGISFGVDRIYDVLEGCNLFPPQISSGSMVLFFNLGQTESNRAFELLQSLREQEISGEIYHESSKLDKQFKYAERKGIPIVIILGSKELEEATCTIKQLKSGHQATIAQTELLHYLKNLSTSL